MLTTKDNHDALSPRQPSISPGLERLKAQRSDADQPAAMLAASKSDRDRIVSLATRRGISYVEAARILSLTLTPVTSRGLYPSDPRRLSALSARGAIGRRTRLSMDERRAEKLRLGLMDSVENRRVSRV
jgi:hypothetical protein